MRLNGTNQYGWVDNPSFKTNTSGCFSFWFKLDALLGANSARIVIGYGVNDVANNSVFLIGARRTTATGTGTYMAINTRTTQRRHEQWSEWHHHAFGCRCLDARYCRNQRHHMGNAN
jgi:hypothetical protein